MFTDHQYCYPQIPFALKNADPAASCEPQQAAKEHQKEILFDCVCSRESNGVRNKRQKVQAKQHDVNRQIFLQFVSQLVNHTDETQQSLMDCDRLAFRLFSCSLFSVSCVSYCNQRTCCVSVWQECIHICLHVMVNRLEIAYRLVVLSVDKRDSKEGLRAETELATHTKP